ncbi:MAG: hypothetical protein WBW25_00610 [Halobacteriota archaeon]|jgi:hypothetical protein
MVKNTVVRGCKTFTSYVVRRGKILPQWVIAASWWESMAARGEMSAEDPALLIEGWKDRFQNAVSWWVERGANPPMRFRASATTRFSGGAFIVTCGTRSTRRAD